MRNKLVYRLVDPTIKNRRKYSSCVAKDITCSGCSLFSICQNNEVRVDDHFSEDYNFTRKTYFGLKEERMIANCKIQIARYFKSKNLRFELLEKTEISNDFEEVKNFSLFKMNKLIDQLNEGLDKLRKIG